MSIEWQMAFGNKEPYWVEEESDNLVQPSPLKVVEDRASDGSVVWSHHSESNAQKVAVGMIEVVK